MVDRDCIFLQQRLTQNIHPQDVQPVFIDSFQPCENILTCLIEVFPRGCDNGYFSGLEQLAGKLEANAARSRANQRPRLHDGGCR